MDEAAEYEWAESAANAPVEVLPKAEREPIVMHTATKNAKVHELVQAMEACPEYDGIAYDTRGLQMVVKPGMPVPWDDEDGRTWSKADDLNMLCEFQDETRVSMKCTVVDDEGKKRTARTTISKNPVQDACVVLANKRKFDPLKEMLDVLPEWDGTSRAKTWAMDLLGAEDTPYNQAVCWLFCSGAITRAYHPGAKFDYMVVLKGDQGLGKSTALCKLAMRDELFADNIGSMNNKESIENLLGTWIVEDGELKSTLKADPDTAKSFISRTQDKARLAYGRNATISKRGFVLAGTTNRDQFLNDLTGNRRFIPIECGVNKPSVNIFGDECGRYVAQLWAEMKTHLANGDTWLVLPDWAEELAREAQEASTIEDERINLILGLASSKEVGYRLCIAEIIEELSNDVPRGKSLTETFVKMVMDNKAPDWEWSGSKKQWCGKHGSVRCYVRVR